MDYSVASIDGGIAHLINLSDFDDFRIPVNLLPPGLIAGETISMKFEKKPETAKSFNEQILRLQDDISVFLRSKQK